MADTIKMPDSITPVNPGPTPKPLTAVLSVAVSQDQLPLLVSLRQEIISRLSGLAEKRVTLIAQD